MRMGIANLTSIIPFLEWCARPLASHLQAPGTFYHAATRGEVEHTASYPTEKPPRIIGMGLVKFRLMPYMPVSSL